MSYTENKRVNLYIDDQLNQTSSVDSPVAVIIAGQPGAGKGSLTDSLKEGLNHNLIVINPDDMRGFHPDQEKFQRENDKTASEHTHKDASSWAKSLRNEAIENNRNIIIDGTLGYPKSAENLCKMLSEKGYRIELHVLAVNELQSKLGIVYRYELGKNISEDGFGRFVPEKIHDEAYSGMLRSVGLIEEKGLADAVYVHTRDDKFIYQNVKDENGKYSQESPHAVEKITQQREKEFTPKEKEDIEKSINQTKAFMDQRNAPQEDKNYLSDLSSSIDQKIMKDEMRSMSKGALKEINTNIEKSAPQNDLLKGLKDTGISR